MAPAVQDKRAQLKETLDLVEHGNLSDADKKWALDYADRLNNELKGSDVGAVHGAWNRALGAIEHGFGSLLAAPTDIGVALAEKITGDQLSDEQKALVGHLTSPHYRNAEDLMRRGAENAAATPPMSPDAGFFGKMAYKAPEFIGGAVPAAVGALGGPVGLAVLGGAQMAGANIEEARAAGGTPGEQLAHGAVGGALGVLTSVGPLKYLGGEVAPSVRRAVAEGMGVMGTQDILNKASAKVTYGSKAPWDLEGTVHAMLFGGALGGVAAKFAGHPEEVATAGGAGYDTAQVKSIAERLKAADADLAAALERTDPNKPVELAQETPVVEQQPPPDQTAPPPDQTAPPPDTAAEIPPPATPPAAPEEPLARGAGDREIGIKKAAIEAQSAFYGDQIPERGDPIVPGEVFEKAAATLEKDRGAGQRLVDSLEETPRPMTVDETALMATEAVRLTNERDAAGEAYKEEPTPDNKARVEAADSIYQKLMRVVSQATSQSGKAFNLLRYMLKNDYSVAELTRKQILRNDGAELSKAQREQIEQTAKRYKDTLDAVEAQRKFLEEENARLRAQQAHDTVVRKGRQPRVKRERAPSAITQRLTVAANGARERMRARLRTPQMNVDPQAIVDLAMIAAEHVSRGVDASVELVKEFGDWVKPHLDEVMEHARKIHAGTVMETLREKMAARRAEGASFKDLRAYVKKLHEQVYIAGAKNLEDAVTAVHEELLPLDPNITRRETQDLMSGYGDVTLLSKDEVAVALRDQRGQLQQLAKLEDMEKGLAPLKSGPERREPSDAERVLLRKVAQEKKKLGIATTDPEHQLKSTLDSMKTSMRNQISDLQRQIDALEADKAERGPSPSDAEYEALKAQRDALKGRFEDIFGKPGMNDAEKQSAAMRATEKAIAEAKRRIAEMDTSKPPEKQGPPTAEVAALQQKRAAAQAHLDALRAELKAITRFTEAETRVKEQIDDIQRKLDEEYGGTKPPKKPGPVSVQGPPTATEAMLKQQLEAKKYELEMLRKSKRPVKSADQRAVEAKIARLLRETARMQEKAMYEDFSPLRKERREISSTPALEAAQAEHERVKADYQKRVAAENWARLKTSEKLAAGLKELGSSVPKTLKTILDVSAIGRQGWAELMGHPVRTLGQTLPHSIKDAFSQSSFDRREAAIKNHPAYKVLERMGVRFSTPEHAVTEGDRTVHARLVDRVPVLRELVAGSGRAFSTTINEMRLNAGLDLLKSTPGEVSPNEAHVIANAINVATSGHSGRETSKVLNALTAMLWAKNLAITGGKYISGQPLWTGILSGKVHGTAGVRARAAWELYLRPAAGMAAVYGLGLAAGGKPVPDNPGVLFWEDPDGTITRLDISGGKAQYLKLIKHAATHQMTDIQGNTREVHGRDLVEEWGRFVRGHVPPGTGSVVDLITGEDVVGNPVTLGSTIANLVTPLSPQDVVKAAQEHDMTDATVLSALSMLGFGIQMYNPKKQAEEKAKRKMEDMMNEMVEQAAKYGSTR